MKYVVVGYTDPTQMKMKIPVIFPDFMVHSHVAEALVHVLIRKHEMTDLSIESAGEIVLSVSRVAGGSETLGVNSEPTDAAMINTYNYTHGMDLNGVDDETMQKIAREFQSKMLETLSQLPPSGLRRIPKKK